MAKIVISTIIFLFLISLGDAQKRSTSTNSISSTTSAPRQTKSTTPSSSSSASSETLDSSNGGKSGNPGAHIRFSTKALDEIYQHALAKISEAIKSMVLPEVIVPVGGGMLTIKDARVTEVKIPNFERQLLPPNRIRSRLHGGRIVSIGQWQYRPLGSASRTVAQGIFRTIIVNAEMNMTNQLGRTWDAKPNIQTSACKAYLGQFRVEIEGFGDNTTVIDQCENILCQRIRSYFEDQVCQTGRNYVKDTINQKLATFPTRINLGCTGNRFVLDYGLLNGEPKVNEDFIQAALEGDVLSRGSGSAPIYAPNLQMTNDSKRMISFLLSDYTFNTLFYHAHAQQYRFSAIDLLPANSTLRQLLKINCSSNSNVDQRRIKAVRSSSLKQRSGDDQFCLGSIFENSTVNQQQYPADAMGDLIFKSNRPLQVKVRQPPRKHSLSQSSNSKVRKASNNIGGSIEAYGPMGADGKRELMGKIDIQRLSGEFLPKMNAFNVTGTVMVTALDLVQLSSSASRRSLTDQSLTQLARLAQPILTEMFNSFLNQYAQFPIPMLEGMECTSAEFRVTTPRWMQIDCDVRISADSTRSKVKYAG